MYDTGHYMRNSVMTRAILQASFLFKKSLSAWLNVTFYNDGIGDI